MKPFSYIRATSAGTAIQAVSARPSTKYLAGGTNIIDLMKMRVEQPAALVDITRLLLSLFLDHFVINASLPR
jgi:xanthine dehydrogenase YagS FAD-binding subunit